MNPRAKEVAGMPHVHAWVEEFQSVCSRMPPEVMVFNNAVLALDKQLEPFMNGEIFDMGSIIASVDGDFGDGAW